LTLAFIDAIACWLLVWAGVAGALVAAGATIFHFWRKKTLEKTKQFHKYRILSRRESKFHFEASKIIPFQYQIKTHK